ncbi:MAG: ribF [Solirubrobacterales bacterium]|nr:ribF [Solirubrobacterales bacterium]
MGVLIAMDTFGVREALRGAAGPCVVTMGTFDGVHHGHRALVRSTSALASARGLATVAVTLARRPEQVFRPDALPEICSLPERVARLRAAGADRVVILPFDRTVAALDYRVFAALLTDELQMRTLVVGEDFAFGHRRLGTPARLRELGIDVVEHPLIPNAAGTGKASSSAIRAAVAAGVPMDSAVAAA